MNIAISKLVNNNGQIEGVPKNPRQIKKEDYDKLLKSLQEDADFLNHKPLHVYEQEGKYVVLGGNMRLKALKELGYKEVPCTVYKPETPPEVLRARVMKDNAEFGSWDMDMLANEWSDEPLADWGVTMPKWGELEDIETGREGSLSSSLQDEELRDSMSVVLTFDKAGFVEFMTYANYFKSNYGSETVTEAITQAVKEQYEDAIR